MLKKYRDFTGMFSADVDGKEMTFTLNYQDHSHPFSVQLINNGEIYEELSIIVPDSDELDHKEFFLNPTVNKNIVKELIEQGFIVETDKTSKAGEEDTKSYQIIL